MMPLRRFLRRAFYDENGNIILGGTSVPEEAPSIEGHVTEMIAPPEPASILRTEEDVLRTLGILPPEQGSVSGELATTRKRIAEDVLEEGLRQYRASIVAAKPLLEDLEEETVSVVRRFWRFLSQPIFIAGKDRKVKQRSRGVLFAIDMIRFGGTFAAIFLALFVSLNYQSFWQIGEARLNAFFAPPSVDANASVSNDLQEKLKLLPGLAQAGGGTAGDLLSFLPDVGPPDNRLIIPALNLNVPLSVPSTDALMRGDWAQVEKDIQAALQNGVAHYPGTANPGQAGNFFITGHSSYYPWDPGKFKTVFARLGELNPGDEYWVYFNGDKHRYVIRTKKEVQPSDISVLDQPSDQRISTLMTCTPVGTTLRRLIIVADEVDPTTGTVMKVGERPVQEQPKVAPDALSI